MTTISKSLFRAMCKAQAKGEYHRTRKFFWRYSLVSSFFPYYIVYRYSTYLESSLPKDENKWFAVCELDFIKYCDIEKQYIE